MSTTDAERIARLESRVEMLLAKVEQQSERIAALESENARIAVLETENAELRRKLSESSSNSNKPPSSDSPAGRAARRSDTPSGKPRGGQRGHKGHKRTFLPDDKVRSATDCFPKSCRRCGDDLPKRRDADPIRHQVIDVPKIEPVADDYWLHRVTCRCGETTCRAIVDEDTVLQFRRARGVCATSDFVVEDSSGVDFRDRIERKRSESGSVRFGGAERVQRGRKTGCRRE